MNRRRPYATLTCGCCGTAFAQRRWKGYVQKFCSRGCANRSRPRRTWLDKNGYPQMTVGGKGKAVHRHVMERLLGRSLRPGETVHHKNGDRTDFREDNLELWAGRHGKGQRHADLVPTVAADLTSGALSLGG